MQFIPALDIIETITERLEGLEQFAVQNREVLRPQKHLDDSSAERAYWHAGYASALADVLNLVLMQQGGNQ
jgi:hypothetical protein